MTDREKESPPGGSQGAGKAGTPISTVAPSIQQESPAVNLADQANQILQDSRKTSLALSLDGISLALLEGNTDRARLLSDELRNDLADVSDEDDRRELLDLAKRRIATCPPVTQSVMREMCGLPLDDTDSPRSDSRSDFFARYTQAMMAVGRLATERFDSPDDWLDVGACLVEFGDAGLKLWEDQSKRGKIYRPAACAQAWEKLKRRTERPPLEALLDWAEADSRGAYVPHAPKYPKPSDYRRALKRMGITLTLNDMDDAVHYNGVPETDITIATVMTGLREAGYKDRGVAQDLMMAVADENRFHPIRDYLGSLTWNGQDHIGELCTYFKDQHDAFPLYIRKWLVGAVTRAYAKWMGAQSAMLVLDGRQNLGKSYFVRWLAAPVPGFYLESPINTDDKDFSIYTVRCWIWEVAELGSTTRRADREALKFFISRQRIHVRAPYGKREIDKPALAAFIGTLNNEAGFLSDPTGSRRFRVCTLHSIDWAYSENVDINQVWAQAKALYDSGERQELSPEEFARSEEVNQDYEVENLFIDWIRRDFDVDPDLRDEFTPTAEIYDTLRDANHAGTSPARDMAQIAAALKRMGAEQETKRLNGHRNRGWVGVRRRNLGAIVPKAERMF